MLATEADWRSDGARSEAASSAISGSDPLLLCAGKLPPIEGGACGAARAGRLRAGSRSDDRGRRTGRRLAAARGAPSVRLPSRSGDGRCCLGGSNCAAARTASRCRAACGKRSRGSSNTIVSSPPVEGDCMNGIGMSCSSLWKRSMQRRVALDNSCRAASSCAATGGSGVAFESSPMPHAGAGRGGGTRRC